MSRSNVATSQQIKDLEVKTMKIETKLVKIVVSECPLERSKFDATDFYYRKCLYCPFHDDGYCSMLLYRTKLKDRRSVINNDPLGADVPNDYFYTIECPRCGSDIVFYSSLSSLYKGDREDCPKCGLRCVYLRRERDKLVFAIPKNQFDSKEVPK